MSSVYKGGIFELLYVFYDWVQESSQEFRKHDLIWW